MGEDLEALGAIEPRDAALAHLRKLRLGLVHQTRQRRLGLLSVRLLDGDREVLLGYRVPAR